MFLKKIVKKVLSKLGYKISPIKPNQPLRKGKNLNVGCGSYEIRNFISLDYFSDHYYGNSGLDFKRIQYDMRNDTLPFKKSEVDNIYCSHVIEHIETEYVERFFADSFRVLKKNGTLRISCPDSYFMYNLLILLNTKDAEKNFFFNIASHKFDKKNYGLKKDYRKYSYQNLMKELRKDGYYRQEHPDWHINNWDYERLHKVAKKAGFNKIIKSKHQGSFSTDMQGEDMDLCHPEMSLYMDFIR